jgi:RNA polymerase sigma-70 factor, ECF subfamily
MTDSRAVSLNERLLEARRAWPGLSLPDDVFFRHLDQTLRDRELSVEQIRLPELLLACACAHRDRAAIDHFERTYFKEIDAAVSRFDSLPITAEDVRQRIRDKLYLHDPPALAGYSGQGDLGAWLRAAVLHFLINVATRETRERPTEWAFFDAVVDTSADLEASYLKEACRDEFEQAFTVALGRLQARDKLLLRYAFADGQNVDEIGAIFRVHRATAARWVGKARDRLVEETRAELMRALQIGEADAASIVRAALSRMGTTLMRRLG